MHLIPCFCLQTSCVRDLSFSQSHLPHLHSRDYSSIHASLFCLFVCLFLTAQITVDHTRVQGYYQLKLIPSQPFPTPFFFPPIFPPCLPSFCLPFARFRALRLCRQFSQTCIESLRMPVPFWALGIHKWTWPESCPQEACHLPGDCTEGQQLQHLP